MGDGSPASTDDWSSETAVFRASWPPLRREWAYPFSYTWCVCVWIFLLVEMWPGFASTWDVKGKPIMHIMWVFWECSQVKRSWQPHSCTRCYVALRVWGPYRTFSLQQTIFAVNLSWDLKDLDFIWTLLRGVCTRIIWIERNVMVFKRKTSNDQHM